MLSLGVKLCVVKRKTPVLAAEGADLGLCPVTRGIFTAPLPARGSGLDPGPGRSSGGRKHPPVQCWCICVTLVEAEGAEHPPGRCRAPAVTTVLRCERG